MKKNIFIVLLALLFSCEKFEFHPYQISPRKGDTQINNKNINKLSKEPKDTIKIAVIGDTQRFYSSTNEIVKNINSRNDLDFVIHTGDLVDFGVQKEFTAIHKLLSKIKIPYIAVIGNHDMVANGSQIYKQMYGDSNFSFYFQKFKFIFLNTNGREVNFDHSLPNISWLDKELADTSYINAFVVSHVPPGHSDFDEILESKYRQSLNNSGKVMLYINGHTHRYSFSKPKNETVSYLNSYTALDKKYVIVKIWKDKFELEQVYIK